MARRTDTLPPVNTSQLMQACLLVFARTAMLLTTPHHRAPRRTTHAHRRAPRGAPRVRSDARVRRSARRERGTRLADSRVEPRAVGTRDSGARLERRPPDRTPRLDGPLGTAGGDRRGGVPHAGGEGAGDAGVVRRRRRGGGGRAAARRAVGALAGRTHRPRHGIARGTARHQVPLVRPPYVRRLHGHGPTHGDLGPRPGHRRSAGCGAHTHRPAQACGVDRGANARLRFQRARTPGTFRPLPRRTRLALR